MNNTFLFLSLMIPGTLFLGIYDVQIRKLLRDRRLNERFLMGINFTLAGILLLPLLFYFGIPEIKQGFWYAFIGTFTLNLFAQWMWYRAFAHENASLISPFRLITPPLVLVTGFLVLGELPSIWGAFGVMTTIAGLLVLIRSEAKSSALQFRDVVNRKGVRYAFAGAITFAFSFPLDKQAVLASSGIFFSTCVVLGLGVVSLLMSVRTNHFRDNLKSVAGKWNDIILTSFFQGVGFFLSIQSLPYTLAAYAASIKRLWSFWAVLFSGKLLQEKNIGTKIMATVIMLAGIAITLLFE